MNERTEEEKQQQGVVHIVRKGINKVLKTQEGCYQLDNEYERMSALEKLRYLIAGGGVDLHIHTNASDGFDSPPAVVKRVMGIGLRGFAITDHDSIWGVQDVQIIYEKLRQINIKNLPIFVPGVELSLDFEGQEVHLLGYFPNGGEQKLQGFLQRAQVLRRERNEKMIEKLNELGFLITLDELNREGGQVVSRLHAANILLRHGYCGSLKEAFDLYLGNGKPANICYHHPPLQEGITVIAEAGGIPVLAHPHQYAWVHSDGVQLFDKLQKTKALGLQGVETVHGETPLEKSAIIARVARELGLLRTIGSDYHSSNKVGVQLFKKNEDFSAYLL